MKKHCIGIVIRNRLELTRNTLMGLYYSDQNKSDYDVFLIDNASDHQTRDELKKFAAGGILPVKNLYVLKEEAPIASAWNLFLALSQKYEYRTKLDNDMVMLRTVTPPASGHQRDNVNKPFPSEIDPLGGAPRSGAVVGGVNSITSRIQRPSVSIYNDTEKYNMAHSKFLDHMEYFATDNEVDLMALVPVPAKQTFQDASFAAHNKQVNGRSCLMGGCMMISKRTFDTVGYFDERFHRRIDIEYSQRAVKLGLNLGYHPNYWAVHTGANQSTENEAQKQEKTAQANLLLQQDLPSTKISSHWHDIIYKVATASKNNKIVNLK